MVVYSRGELVSGDGSLDDVVRQVLQVQGLGIDGRDQPQEVVQELGVLVVEDVDDATEGALGDKT